MRRIDTHGSVVFLHGDRVLKMKRAVRFDYMDFSTLARRERFCRAEVALNRRTAPKLYRRAVALCRQADGRLALDGVGQPVEWLVEMVRFDQALLFDHLAAAGRLTPILAERLADRIAAFHAGAAVHRDAGGAAALAAVAASNSRHFARYAGRELDAAKLAELDRRQGAALHRLTPSLDRRRADGFVRYCHGDLHLRNICLLDGEPTLFDGIEFNEALAVIDVLYDLAFLLMDLLHGGLPAIANAVLNRYLTAAEDLSALALLPLFLSLRAAIRSHVAATSADAQADGAAAADLRRQAAGYLDLALRCLQPSPARLVAVGGLSGSGKSSLARQLAPDLGALPGALLLQSDVIRKQLLGIAVTERLGPAGYSAAVTERVYAIMAERAAQALDAGAAVIADAVHARPEQRAAIARVAESRGLRFDGLWLEAPGDRMAARIVARRNDASDATPAVLQAQLAYDLGPMTWARIPAAGDRDSVVAAAWQRLASP